MISGVCLFCYPFIRKGEIDWDYLTLKAEITRIETAEAEVKRQAEAAKSHKQYLATMASLGLNVGGYNG